MGGEIKIESMADFALLVYNFAKFDGPYAVENPPDHYNKCFLQSIIHGVSELRTSLIFIYGKKIESEGDVIND